MFERVSIFRVLGGAVLITAALGMSGCSSNDSETIVASSPTAITISTSRFSNPTAIAEAHCAKHGRKAVPQGKVKLGSVGYKTMWGFDCVNP